MFLTIFKVVLSNRTLETLRTGKLRDITRATLKIKSRDLTSPDTTADTGCSKSPNTLVNTGTSAPFGSFWSLGSYLCKTPHLLGFTPHLLAGCLLTSPLSTAKNRTCHPESHTSHMHSPCLHFERKKKKAPL